MGRRGAGGGGGRGRKGPPGRSENPPPPIRRGAGWGKGEISGGGGLFKKKKIKLGGGEMYEKMNDVVMRFLSTFGVYRKLRYSFAIRLWRLIWGAGGCCRVC